MGKKITHVVGALSEHSPIQLWKFLKNKNVPLWKKAIPFLALAWIISPLDGDWIPILGWLDDLGIIGLAGWFTKTWIKELIAAETTNQPEEQTSQPKAEPTSDIES